MELVRKMSGIWRRENLDDLEGHEGTNLLLFDLTHNTTGAESAAGGIWSALNRARSHPSLTVLDLGMRWLGFQEVRGSGICCT